MKKILSQKQLDDLIKNMEGAMLDCFVKRPSGSMSPLSINIIDDDLYIVIWDGKCGDVNFVRPCTAFEHKRK